MFHTILFQIGATLIAVVLASVFFGVSESVSAAVGGAIYTVPNGLFALRLASLSKRQDSSYPLNFFLGEFIKILVTILLLYVVCKKFPGIHWPSMFIGLVLALQAGFVSFLKKS